MPADRPMDIASIRARRQARVEQAERALERARGKRASVYEAALAHAAKARPSVSAMKSDPKVLQRALARGQVKRIARVASKASKDEGGLFTADGSRYAVTDLYRPTARERVGLLRERASRKAGGFWEEHKTKIVLSMVGITALYLLYVTAARASDRSAARPPARRHLSGFGVRHGCVGPDCHEQGRRALDGAAQRLFRAGLPAHAVGWWPEEKEHAGWGHGGDLFTDPYGRFDPRLPSAWDTEYAYFPDYYFGADPRVGWSRGRWPSEHYRDRGEEWPWEHRHQERGWWPGEHHHWWEEEA